MEHERPPAPLGDGLPSPPGSSTPPAVPDPPPAERSTRRVAVVLAALFAVGALVGFGVAVLLQRGPCEGASFVSEAYGYCVDTPAGWEASAAADEPSGVDAFRDTDAATIVYVEAVRLAEGDDLESFATTMRVKDSLNGYAVTDPVTGSLGEAPSLEWDAVTSTGDVQIVVRVIVAIRHGVAWRLQIADADAPPEPDLSEARELLDSWRFA
jgi:hypothetical protein